MDKLDKPRIKLSGHDGNIFNLLSIARRRFRELNREAPEKEWLKKWQEMLDKVQSQKSYASALSVFDEYFVVE